MSTIPQLTALKQRLYELEMRKARQGIIVDPSITTEARDLDTVISQMKLIDIHRANLTHLLGQRTHFGASVPPYIQNSIVSERQQIGQLKATCKRYGHAVGDHPVDADEPAIEAATADPVSFPPDPIALVRRRLRDIEALARFGNKEQVIQALVDLQRDIG